LRKESKAVQQEKKATPSKEGKDFVPPVLAWGANLVKEGGGRKKRRKAMEKNRFCKGLWEETTREGLGFGGEEKKETDKPPNSPSSNLKGRERKIIVERLRQNKVEKRSPCG